MIFILVIAIVAILALVSVGLNACASMQDIERREAHVQALGKNAKIVVNNGTWFFYTADDEAAEPVAAQ